MRSGELRGLLALFSLVILFRALAARALATEKRATPIISGCFLLREEPTKQCNGKSPKERFSLRRASGTIPDPAGRPADHWKVAYNNVLMIAAVY